LQYLNNRTITAITALPSTPDCFESNEFRSRLKSMKQFGTGSHWFLKEGFTVCMKFCNGDAVGLSTLSSYSNVQVYPNPSLNGRTVVSGLAGKNTVLIYGVLGKLLSKQETEDSSYAINLSNQPEGTYLVRLVNGENQSRIIKIVNTN